MSKISSFINHNKLRVLLVLGLLIFAASFGLPSLARYKNRVQLSDMVVWDGSIASSYKSGTGIESDPYIISNGSELAYLKEQLKTNSYSGSYFLITNNIMMNSGVFAYSSDEGIIYKIDDTTYYVKDGTNEYYSEKEYTNKIGEVNNLETLNGFEGTLDGDSNIIYGLYMTSSDNELSLFNNLKGTIKNLYVENTLVNGGKETAGISSNAENATLENILLSGTIIGNLEEQENSLTLSDYTYSSGSNIIITDEKINNISSSTLTGTVTVTGEELYNIDLKINGISITEENFTIDLGTTSLSEISVNASIDDEKTVSISNLTYTYKVFEGETAGIITNANNVSLSTVVNKANVIGSLKAAGLVTNATNITLYQTYNNGSIFASNGAGLVYEIKDSTSKVTISNSYNSGLIYATNKGNLINNISNNTKVSIINTFDTNTTGSYINEVSDSTVSIETSYMVSSSTVNTGTVTGSVITTTLDNLETKSFDKGNMSLYEFVDLNDLKTNTSNAWVYIDGELPILYIDDAKDPIASLHASVYAWDSVGYELKTRKFNQKIMYSINENDELRPLSEEYIYVYNGKTPLTKTEIEDIDSWQEYTSVSEITEQGFYIIYAKVVDTSGNVSYINSDLLVLDLTGSEITISFDDNSYTSLNTPSYDYIAEEKEMVITAKDDYSGVKSVEYIITDETKTEDELNEETSWLTYTSPLKFSSSSPKMVYVKTIDNCDFVSYANSDFILLNGFVEGSIILGNNTSSSLSTVNITNKSLISLSTNYTDTYRLLTDEVHSVISNVLLPKGTIITLLDKNNKNTYIYTVPDTNDNYGYNENGYASYEFNLFKKANVYSEDKLFDEDSYNGETVNDSFKISIDFKNADITSNIENIKVYTAITKNKKITRSTLSSSIKSFNVYKTIDDKDTSANMFITSTYDGTAILLNSDSSVDVPIKAGLTTSSINTNEIYDTTYENKEIGLKVKIEDASGNQIAKRNINNLLISVDGNEYAPDSTGTFRFSLNNGLNTSEKTLKVITKEDNIKISSGTYYLKISSYAAYDGMYSSDSSSEEIIVPITVSASQTNIKYSFSVECPDEIRMLDKSGETIDAAFTINVDGPFADPNVRVSLYKKEKLTAYDQNYVSVNLQNYVTNTLTNQNGFVYYAASSVINSVESTFNVTIDPSKFDYTGYKYVFDLYDGDTKIGTIEKKFIVR